MVAILEDDPYPDFESVIYQGKHLGYHPDTIPTPIAPDTRRFQFTVCWKIESKNTEIPMQQSELSELIAELKSTEFGTRQVDFFSDPETVSKSKFVICEIEFTPDNIYQSTEQALKDITPQAIRFIENIESYLVGKVGFIRATREYWNNELFIFFRRTGGERKA